MKKRIILGVIDLLCKMHILKPIHVAKLKYYYKFRRFPDFDNPKDLNEKMNWMKFYGDTSRWADLADKYKVRDYVKEQGYEDNLVQLYGKWDKIEDVDWESLPNKFVMKVNNGSGDAIVCNDKSKLDIKSTQEHFVKVLSKNYGIVTGEPHYASIKPCIIVEELLDVNSQPIKTSSLIDYKIWVFNGKPFGCWATYNRTSESVEVAHFDLEWNYHPEYSVFTKHYKESKLLIPKPKRWNEMLEMATKLASDFPILRCDLYEVNDKIYFGEMTFTSLGGFMDFYTDDFLLMCGERIVLPK